MFPVGDFIRTRRPALVNGTLIAINIAIFIYTLTLGTEPTELLANERVSPADNFLISWGFVPACIGEYFGVNTGADPFSLSVVCPPGDREILQPFTAMFLHAGWAHIVGNMLFLWIFGDNVEDRMGHIPYLIFYLLCGLLASATQTFMALDTVIPNVGASGAIAGVLAAYLVMYPTSRIQVIIFPLFFLPFFVPAIVMIGIWFVTQLFSGIADIGNATAGSGVAFWAHIGGFVAGLLLVFVFKKPEPRRAFGPIRD